MIETLFPLMLLVAMLVVIIYDATRYIIPNWLNLGLIIAYVVWVFIAPQPVDWPMGLAMFAAILLFGFGMFALGILGAGDVKLMAVLGLFIGFTTLGLKFLIYMGLLGGLLSMFVATVRKIMHYKEHKPRIFTPKEPVPYGLAIAISFIILLTTDQVSGMPTLLQIMP